jgi:hypothetical protein
MAPAIDVAARTALIAKLFHRRHMFKPPELARLWVSGMHFAESLVHQSYASA